MNSDIEEGEMEKRLARAEAAIAALAPTYVGWALADIEKCAEWLAAARAAPDADKSADAVQALFGVAHNIKGQGSSFGYPLMTQLGASLCRLTRNRGTLAASDFELIASHLAAMRLVLTQKIRGDGGELGTRLVQRLEALVIEALPTQPPDDGSDLVR